MTGNVKVGGEESEFTSITRQQKPTPTLRRRLGLEELYSLKVWRASVAELLGTAALVFTVDTIVISSNVTETRTPIIVMSLLISVSVTILVLATIPASGGHINPVVSFAAMLIGLMPVSRAFIYILAQCMGGVLGALALKAVVSSSIEHAFSLGGCTITLIEPGPTGPITVGLDTTVALWLEIACTFLFLFAAVRNAFNERLVKALGLVPVCIIIGIVLGLLVFVSSTVTARRGYAGAAMNPAKCLGPAIVRGGHLWDGHWVFWAGPAIACVTFFLYVKIIPINVTRSN